MFCSSGDKTALFVFEKQRADQLHGIHGILHKLRSERNITPFMALKRRKIEERPGNTRRDELIGMPAALAF
jgi:hypothetical protein